MGVGRVGADRAGIAAVTRSFFGTEAALILDRDGYTTTPKRGKAAKEETVCNVFTTNTHIESLQAPALVTKQYRAPWKLEI